MFDPTRDSREFAFKMKQSFYFPKGFYITEGDNLGY